MLHPEGMASSSLANAVHHPLVPSAQLHTQQGLLLDVKSNQAAEGWLCVAAWIGHGTWSQRVAVSTSSVACAHPWRVHRVPDVLEGHVGRLEGQPSTSLRRLRPNAGHRCSRRGRGLQPWHLPSTCRVTTGSMPDTAWYQTSTSGQLGSQGPRGSWVGTCTAC